MEARFRARLAELLDDARVPAGVLRGLPARLDDFLTPFVEPLGTEARRLHARQYARGLLSDLGSKTVEAIAYLHDRERQGLQKFIGQADWEHRPLLDELARQLAGELGEPDGVLAFDPSSFPKKGTASVGVGRQWCGRLGKVENCQVGVYLAYVTRRGHALADFRLYLPREWAADRARRREAGVPKQERFRTRHESALEILDARGATLPHAWVTGDDEMGRSTAFRAALRGRGERYLLAVPSNTLVRDLAAPEPPYPGRGRPPAVPFRRADLWAGALAESAWREVDVRDGEHGPLVTQVARGLVEARSEGKPTGRVEQLLVFRERQADGSWKHDDLLSNAPLDTPVAEFARAHKAHHRVEECLKRAKGQAGLGDYQVRTWEGWHHHQALALVAAWFLTREALRGEKAGAGADGAAPGRGAGGGAAAEVGVRPGGPHEAPDRALAGAKRAGEGLPLAQA